MVLTKDQKDEIAKAAATAARKQSATDRKNNQVAENKKSARSWDRATGAIFKATGRDMKGADTRTWVQFGKDSIGCRLKDVSEEAVQDTPPASSVKGKSQQQSTSSGNDRNKQNNRPEDPQKYAKCSIVDWIWQRDIVVHVMRAMWVLTILFMLKDVILPFATMHHEEWTDAMVFPTQWTMDMVLPNVVVNLAAHGVCLLLLAFACQYMHKNPNPNMKGLRVAMLGNPSAIMNFGLFVMAFFIFIAAWPLRSSTYSASLEATLTMEKTMAYVGNGMHNGAPVLSKCNGGPVTCFIWSVGSLLVFFIMRASMSPSEVEEQKNDENETPEPVGDGTKITFKLVNMMLLIVLLTMACAFVSVISGLLSTFGGSYSGNPKTFERQVSPWNAGGLLREVAKYDTTSDTHKAAKPGDSNCNVGYSPPDKKGGQMNVCLNAEGSSFVVKPNKTTAADFFSTGWLLEFGNAGSGHPPTDEKYTEVAAQTPKTMTAVARKTLGGKVGLRETRMWMFYMYLPAIVAFILHTTGMPDPTGENVKIEYPSLVMFLTLLALMLTLYPVIVGNPTQGTRPMFPTQNDNALTYSVIFLGMIVSIVTYAMHFGLNLVSYFAATAQKAAGCERWSGCWYAAWLLFSSVGGWAVTSINPVVQAWTIVTGLLSGGVALQNVWGNFALAVCGNPDSFCHSLVDTSQYTT
jgi:hypothetical protein